MAPARRCLAALLVLALAGGCLAAHERKLQAGARPAIVNGDNAPVGRYRYLASLRAPQTTAPFDYHICGGTLIAPTLVLTAAHCMRDPGIAANCAARPPLKSVVVGRYTRLGGTPSDDGAEVRGVKGAYVNPAWTCTFNTAGITEDFMNNDVAILELDAPIDTIAPVQLIGLKPKPQWNNPVRTQSLVTVLGWGSIRNPFQPPVGGEPALDLQQMRMQLLDLNAACQTYYGEADWGPTVAYRSYNNFANNSMICASRYWPTSDGGFCQGDSGGPLVFTGPTAATDKQIGIVSFGPPDCVNPVVPYVYTDIGNTYPWIEAMRKQLQGLAVTAGVSGAGPVATGFDSIQRPAVLPAGDLFTIAASTSLGWALAGRPAEGLGLDRVQWRWGGLGAGLNLETGELAGEMGQQAFRWVTVNNRVVAPNTFTRGGDGAVRYSAVRTGVSKSVQISQPGVTVTAVQPWVREGGAWGWAPRLEVTITLAAPPANLASITGVLGGTFPTQTGLVYNAATSARVARATAARRPRVGTAAASKLPANAANQARFAKARAAAAKRG